MIVFHFFIQTIDPGFVAYDMHVSFEVDENHTPVNVELSVDGTENIKCLAFIPTLQVNEANHMLPKNLVFMKVFFDAIDLGVSVKAMIAIEFDVDNDNNIYDLDIEVFHHENLRQCVFSASS